MTDDTTSHENSTLLEDLEIRKRLNHMVMALQRLTALARGETADPSGMKDIEPTDQLEAAMGKANVELIEGLNSIDLQKMIPLPRGPQDPWEAPAGVLLLQRSCIVNIIVVKTHQGCDNSAPLRR